MSRMEEEEEEEEEEDKSERLLRFESPHNSSNVRMWERKVFYCVPIPGEAKWAQERDCSTDDSTDGRKENNESNGLVDFTCIGSSRGTDDGIGGGSAKKRTRDENNEEEKVKDKEAKMKEENNDLCDSEDTMEAMPMRGTQKTEQ